MFLLLAIENKLRTLNSTAKLRVSEALNSSYVAIESLNKYRQALRMALDDDVRNEAESKEVQWRQVTDLFDMQTADVNEAQQKFTLAKSVLNELDQMVKEIKSIEFSKNVRNLRDVQLDLINELRALQAEQNKVILYLNI